MHPWMKRLLSAALAAGIFAPAFARAADPVDVTLEARRVVARPGAHEALEPGDLARPGDVIEYRATYRNSGEAPVKRLAATLPIPGGMSYLPRSAHPGRVLASVDGKAFAPVPLKRRVRMADGREVEREVPASEYRYLRWPLGALDARAQQTVRARVRVNAGTEVAARR